VARAVGNYSAGRGALPAGLFFLESGLPKRRLSVAEFSTKLFAVENSGGTTSWAVPGDVNGMNDEIGTLPDA